MQRAQGSEVLMEQRMWLSKPLQPQIPAVSDVTAGGRAIQGHPSNSIWSKIWPSSYALLFTQKNDLYAGIHEEPVGLKLSISPLLLKNQIWSFHWSPSPDQISRDACEILAIQISIWIYLLLVLEGKPMHWQLATLPLLISRLCSRSLHVHDSHVLLPYV